MWIDERGSHLGPVPLVEHWQELSLLSCNLGRMARHEYTGSTGASSATLTALNFCGSGRNGRVLLAYKPSS